MRWLRILAWDGLLPFVVVMIPTVLRLLNVDELLIGLLVLLIVLIAAFVRAHVAHNRIHEICEGRPTFLRQLALAMAIVVLLIFEVVASILQSVKPREPEPYLLLVALYLLYLLYLTVIIWALRPISQPDFNLLADERSFLDVID